MGMKQADRRTIGIKALRKILGVVLAAAEKGQEITVTRHGEPVALIGPPKEAAQSTRASITVA